MLKARILNVKQAAKILGLSTNTTYKYLNEGRIEAARGHKRGTFRIPLKSLENFLGSKINLEQVDPKPTSHTTPDEAILEVSPPSLTTKVSRFLLILSLLLIILDLTITSQFSLSSQIIRLSLVCLFLLLTYQFGGFVKK